MGGKTESIQINVVNFKKPPNASEVMKLILGSMIVIQISRVNAFENDLC